MNRRWVIVLAALILAGCAHAQSASPERSNGVITITAADLPLPEPSPAQSSDATSGQRIIALANGSAEIVYALGLASALVGRDIASTFPGDSTVPIVTSAHSVSAEKVLAQRPTLVIIDPRTGPAEALKQIKNAGVRIEVIPEAWTLRDMSPRIRAIGALLGQGNAAAELIARDEKQIAQLRKQAGARGVRVAFLYLRGTASIYLLGGKGSGADALIESLGAIDVGAEAGLPAFTPLTSEALIARKPDVLLVMTKGLQSVGGLEGLVALPGVAQTPAGAAKRVIAVDDEVMLAFGPRTAQLLSDLGKAIAGFQISAAKTSAAGGVG